MVFVFIGLDWSVLDCGYWVSKSEGEGVRLDVSVSVQTLCKLQMLNCFCFLSLFVKCVSSSMCLALSVRV